MCNRWKSGRDLPSIRAAGRNIPLMTCVCSMAKANSKLLSCFFSQGKFYAEELEPLRGVLILDSLKGAQYMANKLVGKKRDRKARNRDQKRAGSRLKSQQVYADSNGILLPGMLPRHLLSLEPSFLKLDT